MDMGLAIQPARPYSIGYVEKFRYDDRLAISAFKILIVCGCHWCAINWVNIGKFFLKLFANTVSALQTS